MLYWLTGTAGSAACVGYASAGWGGVLVGSAHRRHHVRPRRRQPPLAETDNIITMRTDITERGGHCAALEEPDTLAANIRDFFRPVPR